MKNIAMFPYQSRLAVKFIFYIGFGSASSAGTLDILSGIFLSFSFVTVSELFCCGF